MSIKRRLAALQLSKNSHKQSQIAAVLSASDSPYSSDLNVVNELERAVLACSATELVSRIASEQYSCYAVLLAFIRQTIRIDKQCTIVTELRFAEALREAKALDSLPRAQRGPLHGLPVSLKDSVGVKGLDSTLGVTSYANSPTTDDALIVKILRSKGALIYVKSNIPQTLISFECSNPLFGRSLHYENPRFTPGGSSGGESVLLAGCGSVVGIGTDIGGSVRIPAHFSGNYALKCTSRRLSTMGFRSSVPGQETIPGVAGPMASNVDDLILLMKHLVSQTAFEGDKDLIPLPINDEILTSTEKLRIGYYVDDGFLSASPACSRAVLETVKVLESLGHECVPWQPPSILDAITLYYSLMSADGAHTMTDQLKHEIYEDYVSALTSAVRIPALIKSLVTTILQRVLHDTKTAAVFGAARTVSVNQLWKLQNKKKLYKNDFWAAFHAQRLDAIISPCHALPAVKHGQYKAISFTAAFTMLYNVLDAPAGVVPVTRVNAATDQWPAATARTSLLEKATRKCYNPSESNGLPIAVQVAAAPYRDELVLRVMKEIAASVPFQRPGLSQE